jgi:site-specific DNA-methyltransferase (adenine-specific)
MPAAKKKRAPLNRTIDLSAAEKKRLSNQILKLNSDSNISNRKTIESDITNRIINQDLFEVIKFLPDQFVDLLFIDPPYNLNKKFASVSFKKMQSDDYETWLESWLGQLIKILKPNASVYFCCDWKTSVPAYNILNKYFIVQNRITWEREKGRGAKSNWKNCSEDIWFCTVSDDYKFDIEAVKIKRKVLAPYKTNDGKPKDWSSENGLNYRITHPSNLWTDITIPFWSMPENTDHPTQKPEKLLAKIILASSKEADFIFDPFLGSGTTAVVAKKLNRKYCGIELDPDYCALALKRLELAEMDKSIQGYDDGVFWERNTKNLNKK